MIKWTKPSGQEVETNDLPATIKAALNLGWVRNNGNAKESPVKNRRDRTKKTV